MLSLFCQHIFKGLIELYAFLVKYLKDIRENLFLPKTYKEIRVAWIDHTNI